MLLEKPNRMISLLATRAEEGHIHVEHLRDLLTFSIQLKVDEAVREQPRLNNFRTSNAEELRRLIAQKCSCVEGACLLSDCIVSQKAYADRLVAAGIDATIGFLVECWGDEWVRDEIMRREVPMPEKSNNSLAKSGKASVPTIVSKEDVRTVAETIRAQLGGRKFTTMTGAKNFMCGTDEKSGRPYLSFQLPQRTALSNIWCVRVIYTNMDLYDIEYLSSKRVRNKYGNYAMQAEVIATTAGIYADQLRHNFEEKTGLLLTLGPVFESSRREQEDEAQPELSV